MENYTIKDWMKVDQVAFDVPEEQLEKLRLAAEVFHNLAVEYNVPYVLGYVTGSDNDTCHMTTGSQLVPMERTPAELLVSYVSNLYGVEEVMNLIYDLGTE